MYKNKIVLFTTKYCKYCKLVKEALSEFDEIVIDDIYSSGNTNQITPSLCAFDANGKMLESLQGAKPQTIYLRFLKKYVNILLSDD